MFNSEMIMSKRSAQNAEYSSKAARVDNTDVARVKANLPFG